MEGIPQPGYLVLADSKMTIRGYLGGVYYDLSLQL
jgi:hypothetical protein